MENLVYLLMSCPGKRKIRFGMRYKAIKEHDPKTNMLKRASTSHIFWIHNSIRDGQLSLPNWQSITGREKEVLNHFELPLLPYLPETCICTPSSSTCWSLFLEQTPPIERCAWKLPVWYHETCIRMIWNPISVHKGQGKHSSHYRRNKGTVQHSKVFGKHKPYTDGH